MALRKRNTEEQQELWVATTDIAQAPRHVFCDRLNKLLSEAGFDLIVEQLAEPYYANGGRPGIAPEVYFRMFFIGYFEGIDSQRGIAWRCEDSLSLRKFLGLKLSENTPDHSSLTWGTRGREDPARFVWRVCGLHDFSRGEKGGLDRVYGVAAEFDDLSSGCFGK